MRRQNIVCISKKITHIGRKFGNFESWLQNLPKKE